MSKKRINPKNLEKVITPNHFITEFKNTLKGNTPKDIIRALNEVNLSVYETKEDFQKYVEAIYNFSVFYFDTYGDNEEIEELMIFNWKGELPLVLEKGLEIEKIIEELKIIEIYENLEENLKKKVDTLANYILDSDKLRQLEIIFSCDCSEQLFLDGLYYDEDYELDEEDIENKEHEENLLKGKLASLLLDEGFLFVNYIDDEDDEETIGFEFKSSNIKILSRDEYLVIQKDLFIKDASEDATFEDIEEMKKNFDEIVAKGVIYKDIDLKFK